VSKETIELTFLAAIQFLTLRQRAVLIVRDVLDWSAKETASLLGSSVASVNRLCSERGQIEDAPTCEQVGVVGSSGSKRS
jgi:DNA-directed RNA polymerase specialized sigma24 family protein